MRDSKKNQRDSGNTSKIKTTPENVAEANKSLFHATMNLPNAAKHCGMTEREMKHIFREYLKYNEPTYDAN
jgi:hypothetical protein